MRNFFTAPVLQKSIYTCVLNMAQWPSSSQYANACLLQGLHQYAV